jgi:hypothetical protein
MHHYAIHLRSRRFLVAVAVTLAALLLAGVSTAVRSAQSATPQANAAAAAPTANLAISGFHDAPINMASTMGFIAQLKIPAAGNYVINAKLSAHSTNGAVDSTNAKCKLFVGNTFDEVDFDVQRGGDESLALQLVHTFAGSGFVNLHCTDSNLGNVQAVDTKITAVQVAELTNNPI